MSQFDETTELRIISAQMPEEFQEKVNELLANGGWKITCTEMSVTDHHYWAMAIRSPKSAKASMEVMARALLDISVHEIEVDGIDVESLAATEAKKAIAQVKARGYWPLESP